MEAADCGPVLFGVAGEEPDRARPDARPSDLGAADQQVGGVVEGEHGRHLPGPRKARRRRGAAASAPPVTQYSKLFECIDTRCFMLICNSNMD